MTFDRSSKAAVALIGGLSVAIMTSGTAYAYWTTTGSGTGAATATTSAPLVVTGKANVTGLYPTATDLPGGSVEVTNPNPFAVAVTGATFGAATTAAAGCTAGAVSFAVAPGSPTSIGPGATIAVPFTASMTNASENACQGATFTAMLSVTAESRS